MEQDNFYLKIESDAFFERWYTSINNNYDGIHRSNNSTVLDHIQNNIDLHNLKVLEVGCFIGDLLFHLKKNESCKIHGIEPSTKACKLAHEKFGLAIENTNFIGSKWFSMAQENREYFDLIILDDVLSWISRENILQSIAVVDWLLKKGGSIFLRDFGPAFSFAYENHHQKNQNVYNFKQANGHRSFFLDSGMYYEKFTKITNVENLQQVKTTRADSTVWSDSLIIKCLKPLHPILKL